MKLAVLNLTGGGASIGLLRYLKAILPRLSENPGISEILCASPASLQLETRLAGVSKIKFATCESFRFLRHRPDKALKLALDEFQPDLIFIPLERYVKYRDVKVVTVLHNMAPLLGARSGCGFMGLLKSWAQGFEARIAARNSAAVIAPTEYVKNFLTGKLGLSPAKVAIIPFGSDPLPKGQSRPAGLPQDAAAHFIFTAGTMEMYRGVEDLIEVLPLIRKAFPGLKLAVGGSSRPATVPYLERMKALASTRGVQNEVLWLGKLTDGEMSWCYANCAAVAVTSRVESFGFVGLEALAHGCNCVSSDSPCLPEIFKDTALYYKPGDIHVLEKALNEVLSRGSEEREKYKVKAFKRAWEFSWDASAESTFAVLKSMAKR